MASPPLVVMYCLMGNMAHDWQNEPIGNDTNGNPVMLKDIWFDNEELRAV